jgi:hypothetical protein
MRRTGNEQQIQCAETRDLSVSSEYFISLIYLLRELPLTTLFSRLNLRNQVHVKAGLHIN